MTGETPSIVCKSPHPSIKRLLVVGATGRAGTRIVNLGISRGLEVTAFVRNSRKLSEQFGGKIPSCLTVIAGDASDQAALIAAMQNQDVVVNAAGNAMKTKGYVALVTGIIRATEKALGPGGRIWLFGSTAVLDVPGRDIMGVDLPRMPTILRSHKAVYQMLCRSSLNWSMLCPGPMTASTNTKGRASLRTTIDTWPFGVPILSKFLPRIFLTLIFNRKRSGLTVSFDDAAEVILDNLGIPSKFCRKRVGVALV